MATSQKNIAFYFKNLKPTQAIKSYTIGKLDKLEKILHHPQRVDVRFSHLKKKHICEITVHADNNVFHIQKVDTNMYQTIDLVIHSLQKAIKRSRKKRAVSGEEENIKSYLPVFEKREKKYEERGIHILEVPHKPMHDQEAFLQLKERRYKFMMYRYIDTKRFSLLYLNLNGNYCIISPRGKVGSYVQTTYREEPSTGELRKVSNSIFPMSFMNISEAIETLYKNQSDYLSFVNGDTLKMNVLFHSHAGELILKRPAQ